jgi:hypothetical protein
MPSAMNLGRDSGIARRWRRERRIGANAPAAGRPQTADPPAATVASGSGQSTKSLRDSPLRGGLREAQ